MCAAHAQFRRLGKSGAGDIGAGSFGIGRIDLERDEMSAGGKATREPNRAVAAKRADLQNLPRADGARQQHEELALIGATLIEGRPAASLASSAA
jgi:hypothetical protein